MEKLFLDVMQQALRPMLRGRGVQIGGERLTEEIIRVQLFASANLKAQGKEVAVPGDTLLLFSQGEMDHVVYPLSIESLPDPVRSLREARRVLKEKGELLLVAVDGRKASQPALSGHLHAYTPAFLARLVELAGGFEIRALREIGESGLVLLKAERSLRADVRIPFVLFTPAFVEAAQAPEGCAELFFQLGILYLQIGDTRRAKDSFEQVLAFEPQCAEAMGGMGMACLCAEEHAQARPWFERAMALDPKNTDYRKWLELAMEGAAEAPVAIPRPAESAARPAPRAPVLGPAVHLPG